MAEKIGFIGRKKELAQIDDLLENQDTLAVIFIQGEGGVGKTRLLQEISARFTQNHYTIPLRGLHEIIDFDDPTLQVAENFNYKIMQLLGIENFEPYNRSLMDWRAMEAAHISTERLEEERRHVYQKFVNCFNNISAKHRVGVLIDTTDSLDGTETWKRIIGMIDKLKNVRFFLAGRNADKLYDSLKLVLDKNAHLIDLKPLQIEDSRLYLQHKLDQLSVSFAPDLAERLLLLAGGRPILIDLAIEWLSKNKAEAWLTQNSLAELRDLPPDTLAQNRKKFETYLVRSICQTRTDMDRLVLVLSRIYPLDITGLSLLLKMPPGKAEELFTQAKERVFIKTIPGDKISLHDEMRRMVTRYVWPVVDPDKERQRRDSQLARVYLEQKIQTLETQLSQLKIVEQPGHKQKDLEAELQTFIQREGLERELWILKEQQLIHTLFINLEAGLQVFKENFDKYQQPYFLSFKRRLITQVQKYYDALSPQQCYELDNRRVKYFFSHEEYLEACQVADALLTQPQLSPVQQVEVLILRGNVNIRLGRLDHGIEDFAQAVQLCHIEHLPQSWLLRALNARGWAYRIRGDHDLALADYSQACRYSLTLKDEGQTAAILNNIGFVHSLRGNEQAAIKNCEAARDLRLHLGNLQEIGQTYSTLGEVYWRFNQPAQALKYYAEALDIFSSEKDFNLEWQSYVKSGQATVFMVQGDLDRAEQELNWVLHNGPASLKPRSYYYLGLVYWRRNLLEEARRWLSKSRQISQEFGENYNEYKCFTDLIGLTWEFGEYHRWSEFKTEFEQLYRPRTGEENFRLKGSALRKMGDLAACQGDIAAARELYSEALPIIAKYEVHERYTVTEQVKEIDRRLRLHATPAARRDLGQALSEIWYQDNDLFQKFPSVLLTFQSWELEGDQA